MSCNKRRKFTGEYIEYEEPVSINNETVWVECVPNSNYPSGEQQEAEIMMELRADEAGEKKRETDIDNLDQLESQLEENKRGKFTWEYIEYEEPEIKMEIKQENTGDEVEKEELKVEPSQVESVRSDATDYDIKLEPTIKLEPSVPDVGGISC